MTDAPDGTDGGDVSEVTYHLALDAGGVVTGKTRSNCDQPGMTAVDEPTYRQAAVGLFKMIDGVLQAYTPPASAAPPRRATLPALFDPLSAGQRGSITPDHLMRLQGDASAMPDGTVYLGSSKVLRAAGDMGLTPDAWFKLAGL